MVVAAIANPAAISKSPKRLSGRRRHAITPPRTYGTTIQSTMAARRPARSRSPVEWASNTAPTAASAAAATTRATPSSGGAGRHGASRLDCPGAEGARGDADTAEGATTDPPLRGRVPPTLLGKIALGNTPETRPGTHRSPAFPPALADETLPGRGGRRRR